MSGWSAERESAKNYSVHTDAIKVNLICPLFLGFTKTFQSSYQLPYILCYNVLYDFVSLVLSLIRVRNVLWEDITQGKF